MTHTLRASPALSTASLALLSVLVGPSVTQGEDLRAPVVVAPTRTPSPRQPSQGPGSICTATLTVRQTVGASGCFIDERVTQSVGQLRYPCAGGAATAAFSTATFVGTVTDGVVDLRLVTAFDFSDRCHWQSQQRMSGALSEHRLAFTYSESPVAGQRGCASACAATANVEVQ